MSCVDLIDKLERYFARRNSVKIDAVVALSRHQNNKALGKDFVARKYLGPSRRFRSAQHIESD